MILRCTTRVLELIGVRVPALADASATEDDWYANLFWVQRRKCLLLMHTGTLFPALVVDVSKRDLHDLGSWVTSTIETALAAERLAPGTLGTLEPASLRLARTASRSMLGFMNQAGQEIQYMIAVDGGLEHADIDAINHQLRRTLRSRDGYHKPIDLVLERIVNV